MRLLLVLLLSLSIGCDLPSTPKPPTPYAVKPPLTAKKVIVLDFTASWCVPCQRNDPAIRALEHEGVNVSRIDIDSARTLAAQYHVRSVPTYIVTVDGKETGRTQSPTELREMLRQAKR